VNAVEEDCKKDIKKRLQPIKLKVCTALQNLLGKKGADAFKGLKVHLLFDQFDKGVPFQYEFSGAKALLVQNSKAIFSGLIKDYEHKQLEKSVIERLIRIIVGDWFIALWKQVGGANKLKEAPASIQLGGEITLDLNSGEWMGIEDEEIATTLKAKPKQKRSAPKPKKVEPEPEENNCEQCGNGAEGQCSDCGRDICEDCLVPAGKGTFICADCEENAGRGQKPEPE